MELAAPFTMTQPAVTKHLKVLQRAGLISQGRQAQWRPCRLQAQPLMQAADWVAQYRQHWEDRLDNLEDYLQALQAAPASTPPTPPKRQPKEKKP